MKRNVPSKQWVAEHIKFLTATPWTLSPKSRSTVDTSVFLPLDLRATGRILPSPGLSLEPKAPDGDQALQTGQPTAGDTLELQTSTPRQSERLKDSHLEAIPFLP